jgi:hypothetical protein
MIKYLKDTGFRWPKKPPNASEVKFNILYNCCKSFIFNPANQMLLTFKQKNRYITAKYQR